MERDEIQDLISKDKIKEAIEVLIKGSPKGWKSKAALSLRGRLIELTKQNTQGVISLEDYSLEKNKIRLALINVIEGEGQEIGPLQKTVVQKLMWPAIAVVILTAAGFFITNALASKNGTADIAQGGAADTETPNKENKPNLDAGEKEASLVPQEKENKPKPAEKIVTPKKKPLVETIKSELGNEDLTLDRWSLNLSADREYASGIAHLKRRYSWQATTAIIIRGRGLELTESGTMVNINIKKARMDSRIYTDNKSARTLKNSLWIEETAKDGTFWQEINMVTMNKINERLSVDQNQQKLILEAVEDLIKENLEKKYQDKVKISMDELELYNGRVIRF
jgi:hypothetical protein